MWKDVQHDFILRNAETNSYLSIFSGFLSAHKCSLKRTFALSIWPKTRTSSTRPAVGWRSGSLAPRPYLLAEQRPSRSVPHGTRMRGPTHTRQQNKPADTLALVIHSPRSTRKVSKESGPGDTYIIIMRMKWSWKWGCVFVFCFHFPLVSHNFRRQLKDFRRASASWLCLQWTVTSFWDQR